MDSWSYLKKPTEKPSNRVSKMPSAFIAIELSIWRTLKGMPQCVVHENQLPAIEMDRKQTKAMRLSMYVVRTAEII